MPDRANAAPPVILATAPTGRCGAVTLSAPKKGVIQTADAAGKVARLDLAAWLPPRVVLPDRLAMWGETLGAGHMVATATAADGKLLTRTRWPLPGLPDAVAAVGNTTVFVGKSGWLSLPYRSGKAYWAKGDPRAPGASPGLRAIAAKLKAGASPGGQVLAAPPATVEQWLARGTHLQYLHITYDGLNPTTRRMRKPKVHAYDVEVRTVGKSLELGWDDGGYSGGIKISAEALASARRYGDRFVANAGIRVLTDRTSMVLSRGVLKALVGEGRATWRDDAVGDGKLKHVGRVWHGVELRKHGLGKHRAVVQGVMARGPGDVEYVFAADAPVPLLLRRQGPKSTLFLAAVVPH